MVVRTGVDVRWGLITGNDAGNCDSSVHLKALAKTPTVFFNGQMPVAAASVVMGACESCLHFRDRVGIDPPGPTSLLTYPPPF